MTRTIFLVFKTTNCRYPQRHSGGETIRPQIKLEVLSAHQLHGSSLSACFFTRSIFLAGISYQIHSTNSVSRFTIYSYNVVTTTMRPLEIATLVSRVKVASVILRSTAGLSITEAKQRRWQREAASVGLTLETSALGNRFEKLQPSARTSDTQIVQFGANAVRNVCRIKWYFNIWTELFIRVPHTRSLTSSHSPASVLAVVFLLFVCSPWQPRRLRWQVELAD